MQPISDPFPHRLNYDGSYDSICKTCFMTVASGLSEAALAEGERDHKCPGQPPLLRQPADALHPATQQVA